jgi:biopolymer transport protein ExbD
MGAAVSETDSTEPMMDMNMTPLIDVLLVLLIMFIITIPPQTHAVKIDLPVNDPNNVPPPVDPERNKIFIDPAGLVLWNGQPVQLLQLRQLLELTTQRRPLPELQIEPDPNARFEVVDEVLAVIKRANVESMGFVGNERYREF